MLVFPTEVISSECLGITLLKESLSSFFFSFLILWEQLVIGQVKKERKKKIVKNAKNDLWVGLKFSHSVY